MDIYLKLSQLVHMGNFEQVKEILKNIHHPNKISLEMQCVCSAVACQRYDIVEYFMGGVPSYKDTAQFFKVAIRSGDHKMVDLLLKNNPNVKVCSEVLFEAIKENDLRSIKKFVPLSTFTADPTNYIMRAIDLEAHQSINYLLQCQALPSTSVTRFLKEAVFKNARNDEDAVRVLDAVMNSATLDDLKRVSSEHNNSSNQRMLRVLEHVAVLAQHEAITSAIQAPPSKSKFRKI